MFIDKKNEKIEYSITGNDVVPQNMIGDIFLGHSVQTEHCDHEVYYSVMHFSIFGITE